MSRGTLLTTLWEALPKRYQHLFDHAMRITVIGSVRGVIDSVLSESEQDGPGWVVVRLVNGSIEGRRITLLAIGESIIAGTGAKHWAGPIRNVAWTNWTLDYPGDCEDKVYERMMQRQKFLAERTAP